MLEFCFVPFQCWCYARYRWTTFTTYFFLSCTQATHGKWGEDNERKKFRRELEQAEKKHSRSDAVFYLRYSKKKCQLYTNFIANIWLASRLISRHLVNIWNDCFVVIRFVVSLNGCQLRFTTNRYWFVAVCVFLCRTYHMPADKQSMNFLFIWASFIMCFVVVVDWLRRYFACSII